MDIVHAISKQMSIERRCVRHQAFWLLVEVTRVLALSPYCIMHSSNELSEQSSPSAGVTENGWSATMRQELSENILPFLTVEEPAHTMCDAKPGRTPLWVIGEHVYCDV